MRTFEAELAKPVKRRRYAAQLSRAIAIAEAVRSKPLRVKEIVEYCNNRTASLASQRTVQRDIAALVELGYIVVTRTKQGVFYSHPGASN